MLKSEDVMNLLADAGLAIPEKATEVVIRLKCGEIPRVDVTSCFANDSEVVSVLSRFELVERSPI